MEFNHLQIAAAILTVTLGAILQASTGLGAGLIIAPILALISLSLLPGPVIFASIALSATMAWQGRSYIAFKQTPILLIGLFLGTLAGAWSISLLPTAHAGILFGVLILLAVSISFYGVQISFSRKSLILSGILSGFMGTTAAIGAPILALLYQYESGNVLRATLGFLYFISAIMMLALLHLAGHFGEQELMVGLSLMPGFILGYLLSSRIAKFLDKGYSRIAVLLISTLSAFSLLAKTLYSILLA